VLNLACPGEMNSSSVYMELKRLSLSFLQPPTEEVKKEFTDRDVREGFDITLTKHKGQVSFLNLARLH